MATVLRSVVSRAYATAPAVRVSLYPRGSESGKVADIRAIAVMLSTCDRSTKQSLALTRVAPTGLLQLSLDINIFALGSHPAEHPHRHLCDLDLYGSVEEVFKRPRRARKRYRDI